MKKWKTDGLRWLYDAKIEEVEVERESEFFVWVKGGRLAKHADYHHFYDTWEEAYAELLKAAAQRVEYAASELEARRKDQARIIAMQKP